ncbi:2-C-methyl-D-erythritol 4-phosphate cytidylyltransferase, partial [Streptococcus agalactiae]|nr:2-C-methyl-D-erythritol 4-phosphate cytidylyltransferase [Streptococcus agalactiae]MCC9890136.1 2-C-methyl-D-erythritol 4-phosphate cytidylyltransferase [Streptococcus agalactiae]MCD0062522.1 2-C-methyl-D-erythritol 4-phosphate cytidylyltransferase [Streptococcus agalactiae]MCK6330090.1 2-C-methyl-D-erythritol 4-phosphate cytidylyltransferase [Streptococcus agalactiae]
MMNIGVIFAGGVGRRMNTKGKPKQFLEVHGKPIIVHTIDIFQNTEAIDAVVVVCVSDWLDYMNNLVERFNLTKVKAVVAGGETGQMSIFKGLEAAEQLATDDAVVLIHDGVRPLINEEVINANIQSVKETGSAVTSVRAKETVVLVNDSSKISEVVDRTRSFIAKAPQSFYLSDILSIERDAISKGITDAIDSSTLMGMYNRELTIVEGPYENIKITTPDDFY